MSDEVKTDPTTQPAAPSTAPEPAQPTPAAAGMNFNSEKLHPWRRWFARGVDFTVVYIPLGFLVWKLFPLGWLSGNFRAIDFLMIPVAAGLAALFETFTLSRFGTTPGKWLFGIRLTQEDGSPLTQEVALARSLNVFIFGLGLGIWFLPLIAAVYWYWQYSETKTTMWDTRNKIKVSYDTWDQINAVKAIGALIVLAILAHTLAQPSVEDMFAGHVNAQMRQIMEMQQNFMNNGR